MPDCVLPHQSVKGNGVPTDTSATKRYVVAIVGSKTNFSTADRERLSRWLKSRTESDSLRLITTR